MIQSYLQHMGQPVWDVMADSAVCMAVSSKRIRVSHIWFGVNFVLGMAGDDHLHAEAKVY